MITEETQEDGGKRPRRAPRTFTKKDGTPVEFTELALKRLNIQKAIEKAGKASQVQIWDTGTNGQRGLSVLLSSGGTKTFLVTFYLNGRPVTAKLGRFGDLSLQAARALASAYRAKAQEGIDPRPLLRTKRGQQVGRHAQAHEGQAVAGNIYRHVVADFIELHAKPKQRTWDATERALLRSVPQEWLDRDITTITRRDALAMVDQLVKDGHGPKAKVTVAWLRKLWRWAAEREIVAALVMDAVKVEYPKRVRDRTFDDAEIKAIWRAAEQLTPTESVFVKLALLLAPRKTALAAMRWSDIDAALWTTPPDYTKSRKTSLPRRYLTPLPPLAQRILKGLPQSDERVFPSLMVYRTPAQRPWFDSSRLTRRLVGVGAPEDFALHACRHTLATWLQNKGHSEWECGLVLNHSGNGSVTAGYSHGYPLELKATLLTKWADHVEGLVQPEGVSVLR